MGFRGDRITEEKCQGRTVVRFYHYSFPSVMAYHCAQNTYIAIESSRAWQDKHTLPDQVRDPQRKRHPRDREPHQTEILFQKVAGSIV